MANGVRLLAGLGVGVVLAAQASAVSFSGFSSSLSYTTSLVGTNGLSFQIPSNVLVGVGSKVETVSFTVTATSGMKLTSVQLVPNGSVRMGSVSISAPHDVTANFSQINGTSTVQVLGNSTTTLGGLTSYTVTATMSLNGTASNSVAKISDMRFLYTEAPVPEPASMTALALGMGAIVARRARRSK